MRLILVLLILVFAGCQDSAEDPEPEGDYMRIETEDGLTLLFQQPVHAVYFKSDQQDQLDLVMGDDSFRQFGIYLMDTDILNRRLPATFSNSVGTIFDGFASAEYNNNDWSGMNVSFTNYSKNGLSVKITKVAGTTISGEISGPLFNSINERFGIKTGKFRVTFR